MGPRNHGRGSPQPNVTSGSAPSPLLRSRRVAEAVVGRSAELAAVEAALARSRSGITALSFEGEPGIGKSYLLRADASVGEDAGFTPVEASADEEIRGPFLFARAILSAWAIAADAGSPALETVDRAQDALSGRDPTLGGLPPDERMLRALDQATMALRTIAREHPIALLLDDVQWADTDSIRLLRYLIRTEPTLPILVVLALRSEEAALAGELVNLLADLERMGIVRRMRLSRFRQSETAELLRLGLGGQIEPASAATIHGQAEGVPFVAVELVRSYRDAGLLQRIDGVWRLDQKARRLLPSAVRTLVDRRAAHLDSASRIALSEAAVLGRSFRLEDLCGLRAQLGDSACTVAGLADSVQPAVAAGLLEAPGDGSGAVYRFSHEQVRQFAVGLLAPARRRALHAAVIDMLTAEGDPPASLLPVLARHALAAGDTERSLRFSVGAAAAALAANAPEEALRIVEEALPMAATRAERVALLRARDDALNMLGRLPERLDGLAELAALAEAAGDGPLELEVMLRRAASLRLDEQHDRAAVLAREVRRRAAEAGDPGRELAACLELGQDCLHMAIGEGYTPVSGEVDLDGSAEAYERAIELAEQLGDRPSLAAALRERGVIGLARIRAWFVDWVRTGEHLGVLERVAQGVELGTILPELPILPLFMETGGFLQRALELYESLGDRRGTMSAVIAVAYHSRAAEVHLGGNPAQAFEEIRRLAAQMRSLSRESERSGAEAQMIYGVHVFARTKVIPDLAVSRGSEAYEKAREIGDRAIEFLAAGGTAMALLELDDSGEADRWLDRAANAASAAPSPLRARQLETWRGLLAASRGEAATMLEHLEQARELATTQGRPAGRCEASATLALQAARLGAEAGDKALLAVAEAAADDARQLARDLPGHSLWGAQANAAAAVVADARGDGARALDFARAALDERGAAMREDPHLEILIPAARIVLGGGTPDEIRTLRQELLRLRALIAQRTLDESVRVRWFRGPLGRNLAALSAGVGVDAGGAMAAFALDDAGRELLRLVTDGRANAEIAGSLGLSEEAVERALVDMYARLGVSSRSEATALALREQAGPATGPISHDHAGDAG